MKDTTKIELSEFSYMTIDDSARISKAIETGQISFFKLRQCEGVECEKMIPKDRKRFCSKECYEEIYGEEEVPEER